MMSEFKYNQNDIAAALIFSMERVFPWYRAEQNKSPVFHIDLADTVEIGEDLRTVMPVNAAGDINLTITMNGEPYLIRIESLSEASN